MFSAGLTITKQKPKFPFFVGILDEVGETFSVYISKKESGWTHVRILDDIVKKELIFVETFYKNVHFLYACEPGFRFFTGKTPLKEIRENWGIFFFANSSYFVRRHSAFNRTGDLVMHAFDETIRFLDQNIPMKLVYFTIREKWMIFFIEKMK
jgi:hypothetical protein